MTISYDVTLHTSQWITLKANLSWVSDSVVSTEALCLSLFAFDKFWSPKFTARLNHQEACGLYQYLHWISIIKDSSISSSAKFIEIDDIIRTLQLVPFDRNFLEVLLSRLSSDEKVIELIQSLSDEEKALISTNHLEIQRRRVIEELRVRLQWTFSETIGDDSWQRWIFNNCWLTWANYLLPIEKQKINITGVMPDYLFPTHDGFVDILEIKLPTHDVIREDASHPWSWIWCPETNKAIGQVVNYLSEINEHRLQIEEAIENKYFKTLSLLRPRAYILIWNDDSWYADEWNIAIKKIKRDKKLSGLRNLNHSLHWIEIITYAELRRRWESFIINEVN